MLTLTYGDIIMNTTILEGNWDQIKGKLKQRWGKLTNDDISTMHGSYDELQGKLKKAYGYKKDEVEHEIENFLESLNLRDEAESFRESLLRNAHILKERAEQAYYDSAEEIQRLKDRTIDLQRDAITYAKKNPGKSLGIAIAAGFLLGYLFKK